MKPEPVDNEWHERPELEKFRDNFTKENPHFEKYANCQFKNALLSTVAVYFSGASTVILLRLIGVQTYLMKGPKYRKFVIPTVCGLFMGYYIMRENSRICGEESEIPNPEWVKTLKAAKGWYKDKTINIE